MLKHLEIEIDKENPFSTCKLKRKIYADVLTNIISAYSLGFVLSINNKWGTGKTTFLKMWQQDLNNQNFTTIYFNAWENDFENDPLVAIMGEIKKLTKSNDKQFKSVLKKVAILAKNIAPAVSKAVIDHYVDTDNVKQIIQSATKGALDVFENEVNEYSKKKDDIKDFRLKLSHFVADNTQQNKPLIFIIDELDRCRPNYAVSILEQIKHFFSIPNIVFVLAIDKNQLGNAIKGVYGSENIDSDRYLQRFIDIEYSLPNPDGNLFPDYLFEYFDFKSFFQSEKRTQYRELEHEEDEFKLVSKILLSDNNLSLREQEKMMALSRLGLRLIPENNYSIPLLYLVLVFIKLTDSDYYNNIKSKKIRLENVADKLNNLFKNKITENDVEDFIWLEGYLVYFYHNYTVSKYSRTELYEYDSKLNKDILKIKSNFDKSINQTVFLEVIKRLEKTRGANSLDISFFLNKIDLTENIKI